MAADPARRLGGRDFYPSACGRGKVGVMWCVESHGFAAALSWRCMSAAAFMCHLETRTKLPAS